MKENTKQYARSLEDDSGSSRSISNPKDIRNLSNLYPSNDDSFESSPEERPKLFKLLKRIGGGKEDKEAEEDAEEEPVKKREERKSDKKKKHKRKQSLVHRITHTVSGNTEDKIPNSNSLFHHFDRLVFPLITFHIHS